MGARINTVMQPCFFALSNVIPRDEALKALKASIEHSYGNRGPAVVERNLAAIDRALDALVRVTVPTEEVPSDQDTSLMELVSVAAAAPALTRELVASPW